VILVADLVELEVISITPPEFGFGAGFGADGFDLVPVVKV